MHTTQTPDLELRMYILYGSMNVSERIILSFVISDYLPARKEATTSGETESSPRCSSGQSTSKEAQEAIG